MSNSEGEEKEQRKESEGDRESIVFWGKGGVFGKSHMDLSMITHSHTNTSIISTISSMGSTTIAQTN